VTPAFQSQILRWAELVGAQTKRCRRRQGSGSRDAAVLRRLRALLIGRLARGRAGGRGLLGILVMAIDQAHGQFLSCRVARQVAVEGPQLRIKAAGERYVCGSNALRRPSVAATSITAGPSSRAW